MSSTPDSGAPSPARSLRILHVEDSPVDGELISMTLAGEWPDCRIERVDSREQFVRALRRETFDAILSDFSMPGFSGIAALELAHKIQPEAPYIFLSGTIGEETAVEALRKGATDYVIKDRMGRLIPALRRALDDVVTQRDRRTIDRRLREQAELLDQAQDAICVAGLDGRITFWNEGAWRLFGWSQDEALGQRLDKVLQVAGAQDAFESGFQAATRGEAWSAELRVQARDGRSLVIKSRWTPVRLPDGQPQSVLLINTDVTEQKQLEQQLLRSQRLESVGMLAGGIAHDLNNVLTPILMAIDLLKMRFADEDVLRLLDILRRSAQSGAGLVRQVLAFAKGEGGDLADLDPRTCLPDLSCLIEETFPRSIKIETRVAPDLWHILSNSTEFSQVLMNLCVNARDAMENGGRLELAAQNVQVDAALAAANPGAKPGRYVLITVSDTGNGIPPEIIDRIFDPFFTTKGTGKGTGLGLSTVLGIIRSHNGFLQVKSTPGQSTEFSVYFPALAPVPAAMLAPEAPADDAAPSGRGETILIVDNEVGVRAAGQAWLETLGYRVLTAADGSEGLELYAGRRSEIGAVVVDLVLPGLSGTETISRLRTLNPEVRIVVLSEPGHPSVPAEEPGRLTVLTKPMTGIQLAKSLQGVFALARTP